MDTASRLRALIAEHYEIGELSSYQKLHLGYCNISYVVWTRIDDDKKKYFLRKYKRGISEKEIEFEHSIINHLVSKDFKLVAGVVRTKDKKTFVRRFEEEQVAFYALFEFLPGQDPYTWVNPACDEKEQRDAASVLAKFHNAVYDLSPQGKRYEPKIADLLPVIAANALKCVDRARDTAFDAYLAENLATIQKGIRRAARALDGPACRDITHLIIHCDFHPGNLKFQNGEITGLFDFDWSKIDARCFDVALAITYFCARWPGREAGGLELSKVAIFLNAYQNALAGASNISPLSDAELECLPHMISAANLYVLNWTIVDFDRKSPEVDVHEYLTYLRHGVHIIRWLENRHNWDRLKATIDDSVRTT